MSKFKDIIYDISDVIVAFCIVVVAGFVIWGSIGHIMDYPSMVTASAQEGKNSNFGLAVPVGSNSTSGSAVNEGKDQTADSTDDTSVDTYAVYINPGESTTSIAQKFVTVGLFDSVEQFNSLLAQENAASKIKTGNFIIPSDSTPEEVIIQITTTTGQ
ncbi:hypothetical protein [Clostridium aminobutyricum]|uniref:Uncharacterized protein n=1 Tax=Clostridium aminobutyricum TaxID=33953 RepID=A0A939IJS9_CLOAM|nr:hypothetical protein [Clostridium aminobutyricum]MBN7773908.1 hypothetical protein [Clostridium aminobutyricum]